MLNLAKHIDSVLGVHYTPPQSKGTRNSWFESVECLDYTVYPSVYGAMLFLSVEMSEKAHKGVLPFPDQCCVCGQAPSCYLPLAALSAMERSSRLLRKTPVLEVPHCLSHGSRSTAQFLLQMFPHTKGLVVVTCYGLSFSFLKALHLSCIQGEMSPPWIEFPTTLPGLGWSQDDTWLHLAWLPFWNALSYGQRHEYLARWNAPPHWKEALTDPLGEWKCPGVTFTHP